MTSLIDTSKEHVWDALIDGFEKYLSVLTERAALIQETDALEQQVKHLPSYLPSITILNPHLTCYVTSIT